MRIGRDRPIGEVRGSRHYEVEVTWPGVMYNWIVIILANTRRSAERLSRIKAHDEFPNRTNPEVQVLRSVKGPK